MKFPPVQQTTTISDVQIEECPYENVHHEESQRIAEKQRLSKEDLFSFGPLLPLAKSSPERKDKGG